MSLHAKSARASGDVGSKGATRKGQRHIRHVGKDPDYIILVDDLHAELQSIAEQSRLPVAEDGLFDVGRH